MQIRPGIRNFPSGFHDAVSSSETLKLCPEHEPHVSRTLMTAIPPSHDMNPDPFGDPRFPWCSSA